MKDMVIKIVEEKLGNAEDNLYRAKLQFGNMTAQQLSDQYGGSGKSCAEIYEGYQVYVAELKRCLEWVKSAK